MFDQVAYKGLINISTSIAIILFMFYYPLELIIYLISYILYIYIIHINDIFINFHLPNIYMISNFDYEIYATSSDSDTNSDTSSDSDSDSNSDTSSDSDSDSNSDTSSDSDIPELINIIQSDTTSLDSIQEIAKSTILEIINIMQISENDLNEYEFLNN